MSLADILYSVIERSLRAWQAHPSSPLKYRLLKYRLQRLRATGRHRVKRRSRDRKRPHTGGGCRWCCKCSSTAAPPWCPSASSAAPPPPPGSAWRLFAAPGRRRTSSPSCKGPVPPGVLQQRRQRQREGGLFANVWVLHECAPADYHLCPSCWNPVGY